MCVLDKGLQLDKKELYAFCIHRHRGIGVEKLNGKYSLHCCSLL